MKILAVDTSTASGSVALLDAEKIMAEWSLHSAQTHNRRLLTTVDMLLHELRWKVEELDIFTVTVGPGSFTGLRIGMTTIKTLAWTTGKPYVAVPSLDALAAPFAFSSFPICTLIDARKKEVFSATYQPDGEGCLQLAQPYEVIPPDRVPKLIGGPTIFCGDGWLLYRELLQKKLGPAAIGAPAPFHVIRASFVGHLAMKRFLAGKAEDPMESAPLYIRPSEAELNRPRE